jgi:hypothetical protein
MSSEAAAAMEENPSEVLTKLSEIQLSQSVKENAKIAREFALNIISKLDKINAINLLQSDFKQKFCKGEFKLSSAVLKEISSQTIKAIKQREKDEKIKT